MHDQQNIKISNIHCIGGSTGPLAEKKNLLYVLKLFTQKPF